MRFALMIAATLGAGAAGAASCDSLAGLKLPDTTITLAQEVAAAGNTPAYCRVAATLKPSSDSDIKIEVWLPVSGWNEKFVANGNGGWSGAITPNALAAAVRRGYATAMTDTGHQGGSGSFALGHPEKLIDFAYRAVHEMTVKSKAIIAAYYGRGPRSVVLEWMLLGRKAGVEGGAAVPRRFRRHHRRRSGQLLDASDGAIGMDGGGRKGPSRGRHSGGQGAGAASRRAGGLRCSGWS